MKMKNNTELNLDVEGAGSSLFSKLRTLLKTPISFSGRKQPQSEVQGGISTFDENQLSRKDSNRKKWWDIEFGSPVSMAVLLQTTRQLAAFSAAGVPILDSLNLLSTSIKHKRMSQVLSDVGDQVRGGQSLSSAITSHPKVFPKYYSAIVEASEQSGDLSVTFETLTSYIDREFTAKRTVKSALYYPAILLVISILAIFILSIVVLPKFELFFSSLNAQLPLATRLLLNFSRFMADFWPYIIVIFSLIITSLALYRRTAKGRLVFDTQILRIPILGRILQLVLIERFTRILGSLSSAGVPLPDGLGLAGKSMGNLHYMRAIESAQQGIMQGRGFVEPLETTGIFPQELTLILKVGEQSGQLVSQLEFASTYYSKEVDFKLKNASTLIEPIILVFVGGGVGFVAVALVSAMYGIYSSNSIAG